MVENVFNDISAVHAVRKCLEATPYWSDIKKIYNAQRVSSRVYVVRQKDGSTEKQRARWPDLRAEIEFRDGRRELCCIDRYGVYL